MHVLTGIARSGGVRFTSIERSREMMEHLLAAIEACRLAWKELAGLVLFMFERDVLLVSA